VPLASSKATNPPASTHHIVASFMEVLSLSDSVLSIHCIHPYTPIHVPMHTGRRNLDACAFAGYGCHRQQWINSISGYTRAAQTVQKRLRWLQDSDMIKNSFCVDEYS
jgi:hypothetical protein